MGFWQRRRDGNDGWDAAASRERMEAGELPLAAQFRLGAGDGMWAGGLGPDGLSALGRVGFAPLVPVVGMTVVTFELALPEPDPQWAEPTLGPQAELAGVSRAHERARTLALERLSEEVRQAGGAGAIGVQLDVRRTLDPVGELTVTARGLAVRTLSGARPAGDPFLASLPAAAFARLLEQGLMPLGLAVGTASYYVFAQALVWQPGAPVPGESDLLTEAVYEARNLALNRLHSRARGLGADGVLGLGIGIDVEPFEDFERTDHVVHVIGTGTAVGRFGEPVPPRQPRRVFRMGGSGR